MPEQEIIPRSELEDADWLAKRRTGVGGSQIAAILGLVPGEFDVFASIVHGVQMKDNAALRRGRFLEAGITRWYAEVYDRHVLPSVWARHASAPHVCATPDGLLSEVPDGPPVAGLEVKDVGPHARHAWGTPGEENAVPARVVVQCWQGMAVMNLPVWHVAVFFEGEGDDPVEYIVPHEPEFEARMIEKEEAWWTHHIIMGVEPDRSTARHMDEYIAARFPRETEPLREATEAEIPLLEELRYGTRVKKAVKDRVKALRSALKLSIGNAEGIEWDGQRITCRTVGEAEIAYTRKAGRQLRVPQKWSKALPVPGRKELE